MKYDIEFIESHHIYVVDGIEVPSITQVLKRKFGGMYSNVPESVLRKAAERGTAIHKDIEDYCNGNECLSLKEKTELQNFAFLCRTKNLLPMENEVVVVLCDEGEVKCAGRLDLVMERDGELGLVDIKTTSKLDKTYLFYQLNLYKRAYEQTYDKEVKWLAGMHLRGETRRLVDIPIDWDKAKEILTYDTDI